MFFKKKSKYEVKPEENIPSKLYGVYLPENEDDDSNDYRRDPRENIPTDLYGVYYPNTEDSNKINEYNVAPKSNRPQILYGPMPWMEELKKIENTITITLKIRENSLKITMNTSYQYDKNIAQLKIIKDNQEDSKEIEITIDAYNNYQKRILDVTALWPEAINSKTLRPNNEIKQWQLEIINNDFSIKYNELKEVPNNWHDFMLIVNDLVKDYDSGVKKILENDQYQKELTELIENDDNLEDKFWRDLYLNYFLNYIDDPKKACSDYKLLVKHKDINNEFSKYLVHDSYNYSDQLTIKGYNAKRIHEEHPDYDPINVYLILCSLADVDNKD